MIEGRAVTLVLCGLVSQPDYTSTWSGVLPLHYNATWLSGRNDIHDGCVQLIIQPGVNSGTSKMHSEDECFNECGSDDCRDECSSLSQAEAVDRVEWCLQWLADKAGKLVCLEVIL